MGRITLIGLMIILTIKPVSGEEIMMAEEAVSAWADGKKLWVEWITLDEETSETIFADSQVEYGVTEALEFKSEIDPTLEPGHRLSVPLETKHGDVAYYRARSKDTEGNVYISPIEHIVVHLDFIRPTMTVKGLVEGQVLKGLVPIEVEASDDMGVPFVCIDIWLSGDNLPEEFEDTKYFPNPPYRYDWDTTRCPDDEYLIRIMAGDRLNSVYQDIKVTVDNIPNDTPPKVRIISPIDGQVVSGDVKIIVDATDDVEIRRVDCLIDSESYPFPDWPPYERIWEIGPYTPGEYTLQATAKDRDGNIGVSETIRVKVVAPGTDITPPVTQDNYQFNDTWTNQDANITLTATDNITGVKETHYTIDGIEQIGTNIIITQEGIHTVQYWSIDNTGNIESKHTIIVKIDKTPPVTIATAAPSPNASGWNNTDVTVTFSASDSLSSIASVTQPIIVSTEGKDQRIGGEAIDLAGNTSTTYTTLNIDKTPPQTTLQINPVKLSIEHKGAKGDKKGKKEEKEESDKDETNWYDLIYSATDSLSGLKDLQAGLIVISIAGFKEELETDEKTEIEIDEKKNEIEIEAPNPEEVLKELQDGLFTLKSGQRLQLKIKQGDSKWKIKEKEKGIEIHTPSIIFKAIASDYADNTGTKELGFNRGK